MSSENNKAVVKRLYAEMSRGNLEVIDEVMTPDFLDHSSHGSANGREAQKQATMASHTAFPDLRFTIESLVAEGDYVATRGTLVGTNTGPWRGAPATDKAVDIPWIAIFRFQGDQIAERWLIGDDVKFMTQLGLIPDHAG